MPNPLNCPSCRNPMQMLTLPTNSGHAIELDVCFECQGIWFDPQENLMLSPAAIAQLFKSLHDQRGAAHHPLATDLACPRCRRSLTQGFDLVRSGRYITYRCTAGGHGRFSAFSSFMIEKGFVRQLTRPEISDIAKRVAVIHCSSCGASVDIRKDHACPHCRSAFSLLDPTAVERALQGYANASKPAYTLEKAPDLADALLMLERDNLQAKRNVNALRGSPYKPSDDSSNIDLWSLGIALVAGLLS